MKNCLLLVLLISYSLVFSQSSKQVEDNQFAINILLPGVLYEVGINKHATIASELTMGFAYRESTYYEDGFGIYPIARFQYRNYYNFERRLRKGKRIAGNSGNYIAPTIAIQSGNALFGNLDFDSSYYLAAGAVYGIQRTAPRGFQFRLEAGPAYTVSQYENGFGIFLAAKIAWVVRKNK